MRSRGDSRGNSDNNWKKGLNVETTKIFTPTLTEASLWKVNKEIAIPIIERVADENQFLTEEINQLASDLRKLSSLGEYMVAENARMRMHYLQRNQDVQHLMSTMQVNLGLEAQDIQHQIHLFKQGNCLTFKGIENAMEQKKQQALQIEDANKRMLRLVQENTLSQESVLNPLKVRLQNKLNSKHMDKLQRSLEDLVTGEERLADDVVKLTSQVVKLKKINMLNGKQSSQGHLQNSLDKDQVRHDIVHALKSLNDLKREREELRIIASREEDLGEQEAQKNKQLVDRMHNLLQEREKKSKIVSKLRFDREVQVAKMKETRKNIAEAEIQRMRKAEEKERLAGLLKKRKNQLADADRKFQNEVEKIQAKHKARVLECRAKIDKCEHEGIAEVEAVQTEALKAKETKDQLAEELNVLSLDFQNYESMIERLENPVMEIQRAQLILKLQPNRGILSTLSHNI